MTTKMTVEIIQMSLQTALSTTAISLGYSSVKMPRMSTTVSHPLISVMGSSTAEMAPTNRTVKPTHAWRHSSSVTTRLNVYHWLRDAIASTIVRTCLMRRDAVSMSHECPYCTLCRICDIVSIVDSLNLDNT